MVFSGGRLRGPTSSIFMILLALSAGAATTGCRKKAPVDSHLERGYALLQTDPQAALAELEKANNPTDPKAILGRGLALEKLRRFEEAEQTLLPICTADELGCWLAVARVRVALGKLDEARAAVDQFVARDQTELFAVLLAACLAHDDERARVALGNLDKWREYAQGQKRALPAEFYLAQVALFLQLKMRAEFDSATAAAKKARLSQSRGALGLVEVAVRTGRPGLAVELLRKIEEERPSNDVRRQVAKLAHGLGDHRLAGDILDTLPGQDLELVTLRAEHAFALGKPEAVAGLRQALQQTKDAPEQSRLRLMLAEANLRSGRLDEALVEAEKLLKGDQAQAATLIAVQVDLAKQDASGALKRLAPLLVGPRVSAPARELAARAQLALGRAEEARVQLDAILAEQPTHPRAARLRVALEVDRRRPADAVRVAQQLVGRAAHDPGLRLLLGDAVRKAQGPAAAARSLREGAQAMPQSAQLWLASVRALEDAKDKAGALAALEEAHALLPDETSITATLAAKLAQTGQADRAAALYREQLRRAADDPVALNNLAVIYTDELDDPAQAVPLAERAHALSQEPSIVDTLGWALYRRGGPGDLPRARKLLESVRTALPSPGARYHLGAVLIASGATEEGRSLLSQALAQSADFEGADQARALLEERVPQRAQ